MKQAGLRSPSPRELMPFSEEVEGKEKEGAERTLQFRVAPLPPLSSGDVSPAPALSLQQLAWEGD